MHIGYSAKWYYSASFFMVGTSPMFGLPTEPWAVTILRYASEALPPQDLDAQ